MVTDENTDAPPTSYEAARSMSVVRLCLVCEKKILDVFMERWKKFSDANKKINCMARLEIARRIY
jgi:hypothetical protein